MDQRNMSPKRRALRLSQAILDNLSKGLSEQFKDSSLIELEIAVSDALDITKKLIEEEKRNEQEEGN